jgi:S-formylglutathione hydrolase FrmB
MRSSRLVPASLLAALWAVPAPAQPPVPRPAPPLVQPAPPREAAGPVARALRPTLTVPQPVVCDETFTSQSLNRPAKYRVLLPAGYDATAERFPVLYLLHGLTGNYRDWESKTHLVDHLRPYRLIVVMPDAGNSWYTNSAGVPEDRFEDYIARDLVADVDAKYRTIATRHGRAIAGLSMGGYGGVKFGLKSPGTWAFAGSFSGALDVPRRPAPDGKLNPMQQELLKIYGPADSPTRVENDIFALAEKAEAARMPYFYLDCGTEDGLLPGNRQFVAVLQTKKIGYEYRELPGAHTWIYWDQQLPQMLRVLAGKMAIGRGFRHPVER